MKEFYFDLVFLSSPFYMFEQIYQGHYGKNQPKYLMKSNKPILQKQHVLSKPQLYLGNMRQVKEQLWIVQNGTAVLKTIFYVPAILKIYDDLLINAAQHKMRDELMSFIQITVKDNGVITIANDGQSLTLDLINQHTYIIQSIFGQAQQSSEYYRMGYSVKLANIFSRHFYVETGNKDRKMAIKVDWKNNMSKMENVQIRPYNKIDYTKISAALHIHKFGIKRLSPDFIGLLQRRAYDIAGLNRLKIYFNEKQVSFTSLNQYAEMFTKGPNQMYCDTDNKSLRWKVILIKSNSFQQISFVNSCIWTKNGGTHVNFVISQIATRALQLQKKRLRDPFQVMSNPQKFKSNYMLIVSIYIQNPIYNSVSKDALITPVAKFESLYQLSEQGLQFLQKNNQLAAYKEMAKQRDQHKMDQQKKRKAIRQKINVAKLEDAANAGLSSRCTLIVVQNDSIRQLISYGLQSTNRDYFGIYTTKNRLANARQMNSKQMSQNIDFSAIIKALGLTIGKEYSNSESLRYSSLLIISDNDSEGANFKGLLLNFIQSFWPSLIKCKNFIKVFIPPLVRCINALGNIKYFLTQTQLQHWKQLSSVNQWATVYHKSLATFNHCQIKEIFSQMKRYCFSLVYQNQVDQETLRYIYTKKPNEFKKKWLQQYQSLTMNEYNTNSKTLSIKDFVDKDLIHYYYNQYIQVVPSVLDGLNKIQRRIMNCLFKIGVGKEIKINQLLGKVMEDFVNGCSEGTVYNNIISLGQCFVGSNNINLIEPIGEFGTRFMNGKDFAPTRHLFTSLQILTRMLFPQQDEHVLECYQEEGVPKQPKSYIPILPLLLINGYSGIDNLWSSFVFPHKVNDIIELMKEKIKNESVSVCGLYPSWQGFKGNIVQQKKGIYQVKGIYQIRPNNIVIINELPPNKSFREYKTFLQSKVGNQNSCDIQELKQEEKGSKAIFIIKFYPSKMPPECELDRYLKITYNLQDGQMTLANPNGRFRRYENSSQILDEYFEMRLKLYRKRKDFLMSRLTRNIQIISQKSRFIKDVLSGEFSLSESEQTWRTKFIRKSYKRYQNFHRIIATKSYLQTLKDFEYLQKLTINDFSQRKICELQSEKDECFTQLNQLKILTEKQMWIRQLQLFEERWKQFLRNREQRYHQSIKKADNLYKEEPSQPSINKKQYECELSQISLDSQVRAELQKNIQPPLAQNKQIVSPHYHNNNTQNKLDLSKEQSIKTQADARIHKRQFDQMISKMEKANYQFQQKMKKETELNKRKQILDKNKQKQLQRIKKEKEQKLLLQAKLHQKAKDQKAALVQKEAISKREALGKHAQEIGKNMEDFLRQQQQQKDKKSERDHLPKPSTPTPRITVPFKCDSSTFQVNHVQRKRFPTIRTTKNDQMDLKRIEAQLRMKQQQQQRLEQMRLNRVNTCIDLDAD